MTFKEFLENRQMLIEGIDINPITKVVNINHHHENYLETENNFLAKDIINFIETYSIFKRKSGKGDGNPLIKALKNLDGWTLLEKDREFLFGKIKKLSEELKYDVVVMVASKNKFNSEIVSLLGGHVISDFFEKLYTDDVQMECSQDISDEDFESLSKAYDKMNEINNGIFSFKYIQPKLRHLFKKCSEHSLNYADEINNKDILVVDDTISSGSTISQSVSAILETYELKSIKVLTVFSKLH